MLSEMTWPSHLSSGKGVSKSPRTNVILVPTSSLRLERPLQCLVAHMILSHQELKNLILIQPKMQTINLDLCFLSHKQPQTGACGGGVMLMED